MCRDRAGSACRHTASNGCSWFFLKCPEARPYHQSINASAPCIKSFGWVEPRSATTRKDETCRHSYPLRELAKCQSFSACLNHSRVNLRSFSFLAQSFEMASITSLTECPYIPMPQYGGGSPNGTKGLDLFISLRSNGPLRSGEVGP